VIEVSEQVFIRAGVVVRPFCASAGVTTRGCSVPLQRAMVDFGADDSFAEAVKKLQEHYGTTVPVSTLRKVTLKHAAAMEAEQDEAKAVVEFPQRTGVETIIAEMDGCMIPLVSIEPHQEGDPEDDRKRRKVSWHETRLSLARKQGAVEPVFAATMGSPDEAGDGLFWCAIGAGFGKRTFVHGVGDGATWIADQFDRVFASQGSYLIDFYHTCEYLAAAAKVVAPSDHESWGKIQRQRLRENQVGDVLLELSPYREPESTPDDDAPVRRAWRYIDNRPGQFRYRDATLAQLPIGSGEIESAHRYVPQKRLKISGAWWKSDNAARMLALRVNRANQNWNTYWSKSRFLNKQAA
jgi:hypothetical protein